MSIHNIEYSTLTGWIDAPPTSNPLLPTIS